MDEAAQAAVQAAIDDLVANGAETGLQVAVIKGGRLVIDAVSGLADPRSLVPVSPETLFWAGSTAKGVSSTIAHVLVEQGQLEYDMPIVEVWPEFGSHGKDRITVRHVLLHTAGVPGLPADTSVEDLCDWSRMCDLIADTTPWWEPGTRFGYHAKTFGFLLGETLRRATGQTLSTLLHERVTERLGVADDVHFGVPLRFLSRVALQVAADGPGPPLPEPGSPLAKAMPVGVVPDADYANRADVLHAEIPSEGTMSARGVARIYSALLGHASEVKLVSSSRLTLMAAIAFTGMDEVMGLRAEWALGYSPARPDGRSRPGSTFGMPGTNGCTAYADIDSDIAVAIMRNRFTAGDMTAAVRVDRIIADYLSKRGTT